MSSVHELHELTMKYSRGGQRRPSGVHALAAVRRALMHAKAGDNAAAAAALQASPDAMAHPLVQQALPHLCGGGHYDEGGPVENRPLEVSSSPATPGVLGAVHDAVLALKDYLIDNPAREKFARDEAARDQVTEGYADGGKVANVSKLAQFLANKLGLEAAHAHSLATDYHAEPVAPVAQQMAQQQVAPRMPQQMAPPVAPRPAAAPTMATPAPQMAPPAAAAAPLPPHVQALADAARTYRQGAQSPEEKTQALAYAYNLARRAQRIYGGDVDRDAFMRATDSPVNLSPGQTP